MQVDTPYSWSEVRGMAETRKTPSSRIIFIIGFICVHLLVCMCTVCMQVPMEVRREHQISWHWIYRQLGATMWVLGVEPGSPGRAISPAPLWDSLYLSIKMDE